MWCLQLKAAVQRGDKFGQTKDQNRPLFLPKLVAPVDALVQFIAAGKDTVMDFEANEF